MNFDNCRLREIQVFKGIYRKELNKSNTESEREQIQSKIDELTQEEKEILNRCDVRL